MCGFETRFPADADGDRITAVFYEFLATHAQDMDGDAHLQRAFDGARSNLMVRLWSAEAMDAFLIALAKPMGAVRKTMYE